MQQARFTSRIVRLGVAAFLVAAALVAPAQMIAQSAGAALDPAASQTATEPSDANRTQPGKTQEEQNNVFRLEGPMVKATAKALKISTETAASIFEFFNFGVIVLLVGVPILRILPKLLKGRSEKLSVSLVDARKATEAANARLAAIEAKFAGLDAEIAAIRAQVEQESKNDEARIKAGIGEESKRIVAAAEQEINVAAAQARRTLRHFAADLAIDQAAKQLVLTAETDQALIAEFIGDAAKGGLN